MRTPLLAMIEDNLRPEPFQQQPNDLRCAALVVAQFILKWRRYRYQHNSFRTKHAMHLAECLKWMQHVPESAHNDNAAHRFVFE